MIAVAEHPELRSKNDEEVFAWACAEKRWVLTENVQDSRPILLRALQGGLPACGLLFTSSRTFHRSRKNPGPLLRALHAWLSTERPAPSVTEWWLSEADVLDWQELDAERNIAVSDAIMRGDPGPMRKMLDELIRNQ